MNTYKVTNSLKGFILFYEEMEKKVKKANSSKVSVSKTDSSKKKAVSKPKISLKSRIAAKLAPIKTRFNDVVNKIKHPRKKAKKPTKAEQKLVKQQRNRGILGIGLLLVVVSIIYSTSVIFIGVSSTISKIALFPQALFAFLTLIKAFSKIYK